MWFLMLLFAVAFANGVAQINKEKAVLVFNKCCPKLQSVVKVIQGDEERYDCIDRENLYNISVNPLVLGENLEVEVGFPVDCDYEFYNDLSNYSINASKICYDRVVFEVINDTVRNIIPEILALKCSFQRLDVPKDIPLTYMRKCCPSGQNYDLRIHSCVSDNDNFTEEWLISRLYPKSNSAIEVDYNVHCKTDEYAMEMSEGTFNLATYGSELRVFRSDGMMDHRIFVRGEWCADRAFGTNKLVARGCSRECKQIGSFCLKKCCPVGEHFRPRRCGSKVSDCVPNDDDAFKLDYSILFDKTLQPEYSSEAVGIRSKLICPKGKFVLNRTNPADAHFLLPSGALALPVLRQDPTDDYCLEDFDYRPCGGNVTLETLSCFVEIIHKKDFTISFVAISISCVFLVLTLVVYLGLPELRNLHGKTLVCHVFTMLLAFCCLARVQYDRVDNDSLCKLLGYGIYFGFVAAFAWLNVMCLDIWWTFGSIRSVQPFRKAGADRRRFAWYSLYAWSVAVLLTLATFLLDTYPVASVLDANMGQGICWFAGAQNSQGDWPHYIFFVFPMGIVTCVNFVLWVLTARHCNRVKSEVHRLQAGSAGDRAQKRFKADKARYLLTGKLWVVMGAGWVWEILSTVVTEPPWLWAACDLVNELQGVSIFLILVLKPKLFFLVRKKLGMEQADGRKQPGSSGARTSSTFLSRSISADERLNLRVSQLSALKPA